MDSTLRFPIAHWLLSRLLILVAIFLVATQLPTPEGGLAVPFSWEALTRWDGQHYLAIATQGYDYVPNGQSHNIAFFPVLPLLMRAGMALGLPPILTGLLANNLALLGALILVYRWVQERHGLAAARWATIALAWCPFSLFGSVLYTEGIFLLISTAALVAFDHKRHGQAALWGAIASATRPPGIVLAPAFLWVCWREKRGIPAMLWSLVAGSGLLFYSLFCWLRFGDPLAFVKVQQAWHPEGLAYGQGWLKSLVQIFLGPTVWRAGRLTDPFYPIAILMLGAIAFLLWRFRARVGEKRVRYGYCLLVLVFWILAGAPLINFVMVVGSILLLWHFRRELTPVAASYGLFSMGLILSTGRTMSAERHTWAVVSVAIAFGLLLSRYPRWGGPVVGFFAVLLVPLAIRFAQGLWAG